MTNERSPQSLEGDQGPRDSTHQATRKKSSVLSFFDLDVPFPVMSTEVWADLSNSPYQGDRWCRNVRLYGGYDSSGDIATFGKPCESWNCAEHGETKSRGFFKHFTEAVGWCAEVFYTRYPDRPTFHDRLSHRRRAG